MVKLVYCLRRLPHLSREEFQRYWWDVHRPLVRERAAALGVRRYVQVHTMSSDVQGGLRARNGSDEEFDGVAELWYDSLEALAAAVATEEGRRAGRELLEDERNFIDIARSPIWFAEEREVIGTTPKPPQAAHRLRSAKREASGIQEAGPD